MDLIVATPVIGMMDHFRGLHQNHLRPLSIEDDTSKRTVKMMEVSLVIQNTTGTAKAKSRLPANRAGGLEEIAPSVFQMERVT